MQSNDDNRDICICIYTVYILSQFPVLSLSLIRAVTVTDPLLLRSNHTLHFLCGNAALVSSSVSVGFELTGSSQDAVDLFRSELSAVTSV